MPWSPQAGSPLALGEHPRLHVTEATIDSFRDAILVDPSTWRTMWQVFITYSEGRYWTTDLSETAPSGYPHFALYNLALIHLMRNNAIGDSAKADLVDSEFTYGKTQQEYYDRCRAVMIDRVRWPNPNPANYVPGISYQPDQVSPYASFGTNLQVKRTHDLGYALAYDWLYHEFAAQGHTADRNSCRDWLRYAAEGQRVLDEDFKLTEPNFSSAFLSRSLCVVAAMAVWGDWAPSSDPSSIQDCMDTFKDEYLTGGYLDMHIQSAQTHGGHSHHAGAYTQYEPSFLITPLDAVFTANNTNYNISGDQATQSDWLGLHWRWLLALSDPWTWPIGRQLIMGDGQWDQIYSGTQLVPLGCCTSVRLLGGAGANNSRFLAWFRDRFNASFRRQDTFSFTKEMIGTQILLDSPSVSALSPSAAGLPLSGKYCWDGVRIFKTDWPAGGEAAYTIQTGSVITLGYKRPLDGHDWQGVSGERMPVGMHIAHRGRLIMGRHVNRTSEGGRSPIVSFRSASPPAGATGLFDTGILKGLDSANERLSSYTTGAKSNVGGVERESYMPGSAHDNDHPFDYERINHLPHYASARVDTYKQEYLIFRPTGGNNTKHMYVVEFGRCKRKSTYKPIREFCCAYCPEIDGKHGGLGPEKVADGHWLFTGAASRDATVRNDRAVDPYNASYIFNGKDPYCGHTHGGRGVCWMTSVLPLDANRQVRLRGGPKNVSSQGVYPRVPAGTVDPAYVDPDSWGNELWSDNGEDSSTKAVDFPTFRNWPGAPSNDQGSGAHWIGSYGIQIEDTRDIDDIQFLTVFQTGDSTLIGTQVRSTVTRLSGSGFEGVAIDDVDVFRVGIFSSNGADLTTVSYTITSANPVEHVVSGLKLNSIYKVLKDAVQIDLISSGPGGVVYFRTDDASTFTVELETAITSSVSIATNILGLIRSSKSVAMNASEEGSISSSINAAVSVNACIQSLAYVSMCSSMGAIVHAESTFDNTEMGLWGQVFSKNPSSMSLIDVRPDDLDNTELGDWGQTFSLNPYRGDDAEPRPDTLDITDLDISGSPGPRIEIGPKTSLVATSISVAVCSTQLVSSTPSVSTDVIGGVSASTSSQSDVLGVSSTGKAVALSALATASSQIGASCSTLISIASSIGCQTDVAGLLLSGKSIQVLTLAPASSQKSASCDTLTRTISTGNVAASSSAGIATAGISVSCLIGQLLSAQKSPALDVAAILSKSFSSSCDVLMRLISSKDIGLEAIGRVSASLSVAVVGIGTDMSTQVLYHVSKMDVTSRQSISKMDVTSRHEISKLDVTSRHHRSVIRIEDF